eukprot:CAMPEP_0114668498 /NCGR_PEP_ID=MMETSP0191-20121206/36372_1 /TAXON_ID=126664 /ORGANISM="Sorites sp." /LENGTH=30 /DNA_ID= /DNA_START= /DNA_END= /DNA_ORIENTATION=
MAPSMIMEPSMAPQVRSSTAVTLGAEGTQG